MSRLKSRQSTMLFHAASLRCSSSSARSRLRRSSSSSRLELILQVLQFDLVCNVFFGGVIPAGAALVLLVLDKDSTLEVAAFV
eukprot:985907-Amphidinium_carterae.2